MADDDITADERGNIALVSPALPELLDAFQQRVAQATALPRMLTYGDSPLREVLPIARDLRNMSKAINFGFPGGMAPPLDVARFRIARCLERRCMIYRRSAVRGAFRPVLRSTAGFRVPWLSLDSIHAKWEPRPGPGLRILSSVKIPGMLHMVRSAMLVNESGGYVTIRQTRVLLAQSKIALIARWTDARGVTHARDLANTHKRFVLPACNQLVETKATAKDLDGISHTRNRHGINVWKQQRKTENIACLSGGAAWTRTVPGIARALWRFSNEKITCERCYEHIERTLLRHARSYG